MQYRREIDGLRAIAVLPVIIFHSGISLFRGGFVGVDIFFVLSGYLITSILIGELDTGRYSIGKFYERRIRRIIPALFFVVVATVPFAWAWMTPDQWAELGGSIVSIVVFASNIFFWAQSGYFDGTSELKPFLHTWSLAVEEQYYVLSPLVLALVWRWRPRLVLPLLLVATLASLGLSEWASFHAESANFYLAPTRAWELFAGSLCACLLTGGSRLVRPGRGLGEALAAAGLGLIVYAIFFFDAGMRFPGVSALVPVGGTMLIVLYANDGTWVARFLSTRFFVGIGLISYSAYLWHQPVFALARLRSETEPSAVLMWVLAGLSIVLAGLSWRFVEQPFRTASGSVLSTRRRVFVAAALAGAVLVAGGVAIARKAVPAYMAVSHPELLASGDKLAYEPQVAYASCPGFPATQRAVCRRLGDGPRRIVIWGDSHANALSAGARAMPGYSLYIVGHWGCPPILGAWRYDGFGNAENCDTAAAIAEFGDYVRQLRPETVFLIARWTMYTNGRHFQSRLQRDTYFLTDGSTPPAGAATSRTVMTLGIGRTVDALRAGGARVLVVQQPPDLHDYSPRGLLMRREVPRAPIERWHAPEAALLAGARQHGATIIPTHDLFCRDGACALRAGDMPLYIDDSHLTFYGAEPVFNRMMATGLGRPGS